MGRILLALFLAAGACGAHAQTTQTKISYRTPGVPLSIALKDLSKQTKTPLLVVPGLGREPVILSLKDVPAQAAMDRIAECMSAEWRPVKEGGFELYRSDDRMEKLAAERIRLRSLALKKSLQAKLDEASKSGELTQEKARSVARAWASISLKPRDEQLATDYDALRALTATLPDKQAVWHVLAGTDLKALAVLRPGERIALSNLPNRVQGPLPDAALDTLPQWRNQHNLFATELQSAVETARRPGSDASVSIPSDLMEGDPKRIVVIAKRSAINDEINLSLLAFDGQDNPVGLSEGQLWVPDLEAIKSSERGIDAARAAAKGEKPIALEGLAKQLADYESSAQSKGGFPAPPGFLRTALVHPNEQEPLSILVGPVLLNLADAARENLVARPDDRLFASLGFAAGQDLLKPSLLRRSLNIYLPFSGSKMSEEDGWLIVSPQDPLVTEEARMDRIRLGEYLRAADEKGFTGIDDKARLASSFSGPALPSLASSMAWMVTKGAADFPAGSLPVLRLYSLLSPEMRDRPLRVAELGRESLEALADYVYSGPNEAAYGVPEGERLPSMAEMFAMREPTELYPNGIPSDGELRFHLDSSEAYKASVTVNGDDYTTVLDLVGLAGAIASSERAPDGGPTQVLKEVSVGKRGVLHFSLTVGKNQLKKDLEEFAPMAGPYQAGKLPAELSQKLEEWVERYRQSFKQSDVAKPVKPPF